MEQKYEKRNETGKIRIKHKINMLSKDESERKKW